MQPPGGKRSTFEYEAGHSWKKVFVFSFCELSVDKSDVNLPAAQVMKVLLIFSSPLFFLKSCRILYNSFLSFFVLFCSSCFNGGTCLDGINTFTCLCPPGFTGSYCQHDINECDSKPCLNGGTCQDSYGTYKCTCPHGYTGLNCQVGGRRGALNRVSLFVFLVLLQTLPLSSI